MKRSPLVLTVPFEVVNFHSGPKRPPHYMARLYFNGADDVTVAFHRKQGSAERRANRLLYRGTDGAMGRR